MESAIGINMCRCCASEGSYKDLNTKFTWMGETEIYADMLQYCFDINLEKDESDNGGICEVCITQLRHASNFKKQVLITEEKFKNRLQGKLFPRDSIKLEMNEVSIESDNDNRVMDDFSEPEYDIPIKEEIEVEVKPKKRAAKASTSTTSRVKKAKSEEGETSNKRDNVGTSSVFCEATATDPLKIEPPEVNDNENNLPVDPIEISKKITSDTSKTTRVYIKINKKKLLHNHLQNMRALLLYTNATPVPWYTQARSSEYLCSFCQMLCKSIEGLKVHILENHNNDEKKIFVDGISKFNDCWVLDITGLKCKLCESNVETSKAMLKHLTGHGIVTNEDIANRLLSIIVENGNFICNICNICSKVFNGVLQHIKTHNGNYECTICNIKFHKEQDFCKHMYIHKIGKFPCAHCNIVFDTRYESQEHEYRAHCGLIGRRYRCAYCSDTFGKHREKTAHMVKVHGTTATVECSTCKKMFASRSSMNRHVRDHHTSELAYKCNDCGKAFSKKKNLIDHLNKHTGQKPYKCDVCSKSYARESNFREHMWMHADKKRYKCTDCDMAFMYKRHLKNHSQAKHPELV